MREFDQGSGASIAPSFAADGRSMVLEGQGYPGLPVRCFQAGVNLVSFPFGKPCVSRATPLSWSEKALWRAR